MSSTKSSLLSGTDIQFLLTFTLGMATFWASGRLPSVVPGLNGIWALVSAHVVFVLVLFLWTLLVLGRQRRLKASIIAALLTLILTLPSTLYLIPIFATHIKSLTVLTFVVYLVFGAIYVIGWIAARRLAPARS